MTIISSFFLFAGLTSFTDALYLVHFIASGPSGIFESNFTMIIIFSFLIYLKNHKEIEIKAKPAGITIAYINAIGLTRGFHNPVSYTHLRAHETVLDLVCRLLLEK